METNAVSPGKGGASVTLTAFQNCSSTTNPSPDQSSKLKIPATEVCKLNLEMLFNESRTNSKIRDAQQLMPAKQIPDLEWKFEEEVQLVEPVLVQIYHLPEQSVTTENDRPGRSQTKIQESSVTMENDRPGRSQTKIQESSVTMENDRPGRSETKIQESAVTTENDRPDRSPTKVQRLLTTTESDRPERLQSVKAKKTENQVNHDTNTDQEDQGVATIETDRAVCSQMTASESSALKILETLIFLLISLATVAVLF